ncbi:hypothetical protein Pmani_033196 [Petrolisthes manimaculis]|uniref:Alpha-macroglobulin receptor-binding domain-containing protein n=1 Tax=Petrolisthes manimaculis TaxID=1843537 RepID=A0AAE1NRY9_9EUCA|nr:hypothetical protein Pmani_033196 [Petrolisthes manimaculis]
MASLSHLISLLLLALFPCVSNGCFLITTPRRWTAGIRNIVCVMVSDPKESAALGFTLWKHMDLLRYRVTQVGPITKFSNVTLNPGEVNACVSVFVPKAATYKVLLRVQGRACGQNVFRQIEVTLAKPTYKIFLQTDKYQYKPSQEVLLRILAIEKVTLAISKTNYSVVWVTAPSGNRIAQWNNVDNSKGLVHLSFQLTDDPELGVHTIKVLPDADGDEYRANFSTSFTVEEYVLPRFEVTLIPPPYITGIANYYVFTVCARYTFGQPVQGSVALQVSDKKCDASMTKVEEIDGCLEIRIGAPLNFKRWSCRGDYLDVQATVTEAGTLTPITVQKRISVYYYSIHFRVKIQDTYIKPYLPFRAKILARRPDKRPASGEPVEVCCSNVCTNTTSDPDGIITLVVPYCLEDNIQVRSMMCSRRMMDRPLSLSYTRFYSPSNSSLAIVTPDEPLRCSQGQYQERQLQLHVAHCNHTVFTLNVMVVARGVIQYIGSVDMDTREMEPLGTPEMVFPSIPWPENCHSLQTHFNISVSRFVSPFIRVSVVDKSVELLTPSHIASRINFTIDTVFRILSQYSRPEPFNNYDHINQYCRKKLGQEKHIWKQYSSKYVDALQVFDLRFPSRTPLKTPIRTPLQIPSSDDESLDAPRTDFPDTWLWSLLLVPESGGVDESMLLPDTITQWVGRAITTILSSPHIINNSLELVVDPEDSNRSPGHQSSCVATNTKVVHTVKIKPSVAIGLLNLTVEAYVDNQAGLECSSPRDYSDIIIKPIRVVAKGFPRETTYTDYLCPDKDNADQQRTEREIAYPPDMVPGTFRSWFVASGDLLALTIEVDDAYLQDAQNWLLQQQSPGGCFTQVGRVIHKALKGGMEGLDSAVSLTAYVTVALLESEVWDNKKSTTPFLLKALKCLISTPSQDLYTMALKAYALALAKLPQAETLITRLLTIDAMDTQSENQADEVKEVLRRPLRSIIDVSPKKSGRAVEGVAYVVLAMMTVNPEKHRTRAAKLVKWIVQERNGQGGFITTQATVVALQALALFSTYSTTKDMSVTLKVNTIDLDRTITIDQNNRLLQQLVQIPTVPTKFVYKAEGTGCVVVETVMRYSELNPSPSEAFKLSVKTITEPDHNCITKRFEACVASLLEYGVSYLAIIEVNLVSGYQPMRDDLRQMLEENSNVIKSYEIHDDMVVFYIDQFHTPQAVCVSFRMVRDATVEDVEPSTVVIYDYYHPSFKIRQYYTLPRSDECVNMDDYFKSSGDEKKTKQRNRIEILRKYMRGKS